MRDRLCSFPPRDPTSQPKASLPPTTRLQWRILTRTPPFVLTPPVVPLPPASRKPASSLFFFPPVPPAGLPPGYNLLQAATISLLVAPAVTPNNPSCTTYSNFLIYPNPTNPASQADIGRTVERNEQIGDHRSIFGALHENYGEEQDVVYQDMVELGNNEELANEFMPVSRHDIRRRLAKESSSSTDKS